MSASVPAGYRPAFVTLDGEHRLPAFLPLDESKRWNGFAMPLFDPAIFEAEENRVALAAMFPDDTEESLKLSWDGRVPSVTDPEDGYEYARMMGAPLLAYLQIGDGAFVWEEDEVIGYEVRDEHDEPLIYCAVCAPDKSVPVTMSDVGGEEQMCAGTDYNSPEAHVLEPESNLIGEVTLVIPIVVPSPVSEIVDAVRESVETPRLADAIRDLDAALVEHGLQGYDGEALAYLEALLVMAQGHTVHDAMVTAYGLKAVQSDAD